MHRMKVFRKLVNVLQALTGWSPAWYLVPETKNADQDRNERVPFRKNLLSGPSSRTTLSDKGRGDTQAGRSRQ